MQESADGKLYKKGIIKQKPTPIWGRFKLICRRNMFH